MRNLGRDSGLGAQLRELFVDGRHVRVDHLLQQTRLRAVQLHAALTELIALEHRHFMRQLIDTRLAVLDLAIFGAD